VGVIKLSLDTLRDYVIRLELKLSPKSEISYIIGNKPLAFAIHNSISTAIKSEKVHLSGGDNVRSVFHQSLDAAIRDIGNDPRGKLFLRLLRYGPPLNDEPPMETSDGKTVLSDTECGSCIDFIYSHMVNKLKGELAELLGLEPCMDVKVNTKGCHVTKLS